MKRIISIIFAITVSLTASSQSDSDLIGRINKSMAQKYDSVNVWWRSPSSIPDSIRQLKAPNYPEIVYEKRIANLDELTSIKLEYNDVVLKYIKAYGLSNRPKMQKVIGLSAYYFPIFEEYFAKYGLPLELKYLSNNTSNL